VDLSELQVTHFSFDGGASSLSLTLPARVQNALVELKAGATSMQLKVPEGLAVRFRTKSVGSLRVDEGRFLNANRASINPLTMSLRRTGRT